jgi:hypothetical protein
MMMTNIRGIYGDDYEQALPCEMWRRLVWKEFSNISEEPIAWISRYAFSQKVGSQSCSETVVRVH